MRQYRTMKEGVNVRLPDGMRDRLRRNAVANHRSLNAEIVHHLDQALGAVEAKGPAGTAIPPGQGSSNPHQEKADERAVL